LNGDADFFVGLHFAAAREASPEMLFYVRRFARRKLAIEPGD
jgi:hypothetical protein